MLDNFQRDAIEIIGQSIEKDDAIERLINTLCSAYELPYNDVVVQRIIEREQILSTGIGLGIAVPHCKLEDIDQIYMAVLLSRKGMEYNAADGAPVHLIFLIVSPHEDYAGHIKCLSQISRAAADEETRKRMIMAISTDALYDILMEQK